MSPRIYRRAKVRRPSTLKPALRYFLAYGDLPAHDAEPPDWVPGFGSGKFEAFELCGWWLRWSAYPENWPHLAHVADDLAELWERHQDEIEAEAEGETPWIVEALQKVARIKAGAMKGDQG